MMSLNLLILAAALGAESVPAATSSEPIRAAVERSIPYIQEQGQWWIEEKKCVSCHRTGTMAWSLAAARRKGFTVGERVEEWFDWSLEQSLSKNDKGKIVGAGNKEGVAQLLAVRDLFAANDTRSKSYATLAGILTGDQQADGTWQPGGQLPFQKRDKSETADVSTIWLALTLAGTSGATRPPDADSVIAKALEHLADSPPGKSTEWYASRLLLARQLNDQATVEAMAAELSKQQQSDGGWGWLVSDPSDALGTGMALYALLQAESVEPAVIQRAQQFLLASQSEDGSWPVKGTKAKKRDSVEETATYWGTTWAVIALTESLPK